MRTATARAPQARCRRAAGKAYRVAIAAPWLAAAVALVVAGCGGEAAPGPGATAVATAEPPQSIPQLIEKLADPLTRGEARMRIEGRMKEAFPLLCDRIQDKNSVIRFEVITALGRSQDPRCLTLLAATVLNDPELRVRENALRAVGGFRDRGFAVSHFRSALGSAEEVTRWNAAVALAQLGLDDGHAEMEKAMADPARRLEALTALSSAASPKLAEVIGDGFAGYSTVERQEATMLLRKLRSPRAIEVLIAALADSDSGVRWRACVSLAALDADEAVAPLEKLQASEQDAMVLKHIEKALRKINRPSKPRPK